MELATLASNLPDGTARERVSLAMEIWKEAATEIPGTRENTQRIRDRNELRAADPVPLDWLLAEIIPKDHPALRSQKWRGFIEWKMANNREGIMTIPREIPARECKELGLSVGSIGMKSVSPGDRITKAELAELSNREIASHERDGVKHFLKVSDEFKQWTALEKARIAREKASNAGKALWAKKRAGTSSERKAGGKTQQVKKRAKTGK